MTTAAGLTFGARGPGWLRELVVDTVTDDQQWHARQGGQLLLGKRCIAVLMLLDAMLVGCGTKTKTEKPVAEGGYLPTSARVLAAVAAEHVGEPDSAEAENDAVEEFTNGGVGAELSGCGVRRRPVGRSGREGAQSGTVGLCSAEQHDYLAGCVTTDHGVLLWAEEAVESEPGGVYTITDKGDASVLIFSTGPVITSDPRTSDMPISSTTCLRSLTILAST